MRRGCFIAGQASLLCMALATAALHGQIVSTGAAASSVTMRQGIVIDRPYTAVVKVSTVVKLADGTTLTNSRSDTVARDASGRTSRVTRPSTMTPPCTDNRCADTRVFHDPVKHFSVVVDGNFKIATISHQSPSWPQTAAQPVAPSPAPAHPESPRSADPAKPTWTVEDLGWKTIEGLSCQGTLRTWVYPPGFFGSDRPITTTREDWFSPEIVAKVLEINSDPRTGVQTSEMIDVERAEPDAALFQIPEGYKVQDSNPVPQE